VASPGLNMRLILPGGCPSPAAGVVAQGPAVRRGSSRRSRTPGQICSQITAATLAGDSLAVPRLIAPLARPTAYAFVLVHPQVISCSIPPALRRRSAVFALASSGSPETVPDHIVMPCVAGPKTTIELGRRDHIFDFDEPSQQFAEVPEVRGSYLSNAFISRNSSIP
jgi:hypothetical protein